MMKAVMRKLAGRAVDGRTINEIVRRKLGCVNPANLSSVLRLITLKGTHKPLIHPPLGPCGKAGAFFCTHVPLPHAGMSAFVAKTDAPVTIVIKLCATLAPYMAYRHAFGSCVLTGRTSLDHR